MGRCLVLVALVGCYAPAPPTGAPCDERMACPTGQVCLAGRCERDGTTPGDAPLTDDSATDATDAATMGWSAPVPVGITVGQSKSDPSFTANRLTVAFTRSEDLFIATRTAIGGSFTVTAFPYNIPGVSDKSPEISPDGNTLYYASNADGNYDIFVSTRAGTSWGPPTKVAAWSSTKDEQDVAISPDELTAFVATNGTILRAVRAAKTDPWPVPTSVGVAWGTSPTAPTLNSAGDVYFHAANPRDLFVVRKQGTSYAAPVPLTDFNTVTGREAAPFISADDRYLMFDRDFELVESTR